MNMVRKQQVIHLQLWKQGLYQRPTGASQADLLALVRQLGCVQLDTLQVVTRSHNLVFLARMSSYTEAWYWQMYQDKEIIEGYVHALSILPVEEYPDLAVRLDAHDTVLQMKLDRRRADFLTSLYEKIRGQNGKPISSKDLNEEHKDVYFVELEKDRPTDWTTTPVRWALNHLWRSGKLIQTRDTKFNKVYHVADEWLASELRERRVTEEEMVMHSVEIAFQALGVATLGDIADYFRLKREQVRPFVQEMIEAGTVAEVAVEGDDETYFALLSDLELLNSGALNDEPKHSALLSPFDNLIWTRDRVQRLFGVDYRLECYVPQAQRKFGYYALPILIRGRLVGTIDLKTERKAMELIVKKWVLFDEQERADLVHEVAALLRHLMAFLGVETLIAEQDVDRDLVAVHRVEV